MRPPTSSGIDAAVVVYLLPLLDGELSPRLFAGRRLASHEYDALPPLAFTEEAAPRGVGGAPDPGEPSTPSQRSLVEAFDG